MRIITANLNGIRSARGKGFFDWLAAQSADFVCVQELKAQEDDLDDTMRAPEGYHGYFHCAEKKGYSGVGIYARREPLAVVAGLGIDEIDSEGRYLELVYDELSIVSLYLPSGSSGEHRQAAKFRFMALFYPRLEAMMADGRPRVLCGDWNIARREADLKNWKSNQKNSGFLPEERAWMDKVVDGLGWQDVYRSLYPDATDACYTWWSNRGRARENNVGWRIDYQLATPAMGARAQQAFIYKDQWFSDHAPLTVDYADA